MNLKELVKTMTREEFLNNRRLTDKEGCPTKYGLKCKKPCDGVKCKKCWSKAVKDIKFKGEDEMKKFNWEIESEPKESTPEPKELFTFQEVIANIKDDEKYISKSKIYCLETIEKTSGYFKFTGQLKPDRLVVDHDRTFYKEELKHTYVIHKVKHTPEGTPNSYRNPKIEEAINDNVICNTEKGKIYGRKVSSEVIQMTEKEYLNYPIIENINE